MAEIETYLGRLKVSGFRADSLGYHVYTGSERTGDARSWLVPQKVFDAIKTEIAPMGVIPLVMEQKNGMTHCWYCGKKVADPKLLVEEGMYSFGKFTGYEVTGVIHKTCAEKGKEEYAGYQWRVVEADQ